MNRVALEKTDTWIKNTLSDTDKWLLDVGKEMNQRVLSALSETAYEYQMSPQQHVDATYNTSFCFCHGDSTLCPGVT
jgi:hypothetical protein